MLRKCRFCDKEFEAPNREVNRGNGNYCSRSCGAKGKPKVVHEDNFSCATCNKPFYRSPSRAKASKNGLFFCSRKCKENMQRLSSGPSPIQPPHYGTGTVDYRKLAFLNKPNHCAVCGYDKTAILQVHHMDHDRLNNQIENLEILCPTHHMEHHYLTKTGIWSTN